MKNCNYTLKHFLDDPYNATVNGYQPSYMDCLSYIANLFNRGTLVALWDEFAYLKYYTVQEFPWELFKVLLVMLVVLSIPLGGFFVLGTFEYFANYSPKKVKERLAEHKALYRKLDLDL